MSGAAVAEHAGAAADAAADTAPEPAAAEPAGRQPGNAPRAAAGQRCGRATSLPALPGATAGVPPVLYIQIYTMRVWALVFRPYQ